jgi:hypothetical protein
LSSAFHPQTDGQTERENRTLEDFLRHYINPAQDDWDKYLSVGEFAVNNAWQESIRETPFFLNSGRHPTTPKTLGKLESRVPQAKDFAQSMQEHIRVAKKWLEKARQRSKTYADKKRKEVVFDVGQKVLLNTKNLRLRHPGARKLLPRWIGPFEIMKKIGPVAYKLKLIEGMKIHSVFHVEC